MKTSNGLTYTDPQGGVHRISGKLLWSGSKSVEKEQFSWELPTGVRLAKVMVVVAGNWPALSKINARAVSIIRVFPPQVVGGSSISQGTVAQVTSTSGLANVQPTVLISPEGVATVVVSITAEVLVEQILLLEEEI